MAITKLTNSGIATGGVLKYDSMLAGNPAYDPGDFLAIATTTLGSDTSTVTFSSIPQTYKHLVIRAYAKPTNVGLSNGLGTIQGYTNGYTSSNYYNRSTGTTRNGGSGSYCGQIYVNSFNTVEWWIHNYTDSSFTKQLQGISGWTNQTSVTGGLGIYLLNSNNVYGNFGQVNSVTFTNDQGWSFVTGSMFALYGVKES